MRLVPDFGQTVAVERSGDPMRLVVDLGLDEHALEAGDERLERPS